MSSGIILNGVITKFTHIVITLVLPRGADVRRAMWREKT